MNGLYPCSAVCGGASEETVGALILQGKNVETASERVGGATDRRFRTSFG